jgi:hypothetical protein
MRSSRAIKLHQLRKPATRKIAAADGLVSNIGAFRHHGVTKHYVSNRSFAACESHERGDLFGL